MEIRLSQDSEGQAILPTAKYKELKCGSYEINKMTIPKCGGNRHYREMISAVDKGTAEIIRYSEPVKTIDDIRQERDTLLAANVDIYNPIRWADLPVEQKNAIKKYRQALLDITEQDPTNVIWPELPLI